MWRRASRRWRGAPPRSRRRGTCGPAAWPRRRSARRSCSLARPDATARLREAAALIEQAPALRDDVRLAAWLGIPALFLRGAEADYAPLRRAIAAAREDGAVGVLPFALFELGASQLATGGWDEAGAAFAEAMRLAGEAGLRVDLVSAHAGLARLEARRGAASAAEHAARAVAGAQALGVPLFEAWGRHAEGELAWARDDVAAAIAAFEAKAEVAARHGMLDADLSPLPELVEAYVRVGRRDDARRLAAEAVAAAEAKGRPWARARAARAQALAEPDDAAAVAGLAAAVALHGEPGDPFERARTQLCLGERLRRAGRRADARPELRAALAAFEDLRAAPWAERAAAELKATGERVRRREPSSLDELTAQELRIAMMLADGATTRQAAAALYLSPKTVEYHLRNVYLKLGVNSRAALAVALRHGDPGGSAGRGGPAGARGAGVRDRRVGSGPPRRGAARVPGGVGSGRASSTRLIGVSATRRTWSKPAARSTSRSRASPACAPSASPPSCDSELGRAEQRRERVVRAPDRVQVVLHAIAGPRLDDHPRAAGRERVAHLPRRGDRVAHVVQAVEAGRPGRRRPGQRLGAAPRSNVTRSPTPGLGGEPPRLRDRARVGVRAADLGVRVRLRDQDGGGALAAADVGDAAAGLQALVRRPRAPGSSSGRCWRGSPARRTAGSRRRRRARARASRSRRRYGTPRRSGRGPPPRRARAGTPPATNAGLSGSANISACSGDMR